MTKPGHGTPTDPFRWGGSPHRDRYEGSEVRFGPDAVVAPAEEADFGPEQRYAFLRRRPRRKVAAIVSGASISIVVAVTMALSGGVPSTQSGISLAASRHEFGIGGVGGAAGIPATATAASLHLIPATSSPAPTPATVATAPPLAPHEVFGFAPYWTLDQEATFDVAGFTTIAYFGVGVNPNGSLAESGPGWAGYQSQELADLVDRAHQAGDRVVLTVSCFAQSALDAVTSDPTAATRLASEVAGLLSAKNLDGVNIDFEGSGSADSQGLTRLVATVASQVHSVDSHWQVTVDTYASSASDSDSFYDVPALGHVADGLFVMAYQLNLGAAAGSGSPLTDSTFPLTTTAADYASAVTPGKVILGLGYYGNLWPTTTGTLDAQSDGDPSVVTAGAELSSGHPVYWDAVTDTAWTSYETDGQWYEAFFQDPTSLYKDAQLAQSYGLGGVGAWAMGFDDNSPTMTSALDGYAPVVKNYQPGPASTSHSAVRRANAGAQRATTRPAPAARTVTTHVAAPTFAGAFAGDNVSLRQVPARTPGAGSLFLGTLVGFTTDDPSLACLSTGPPLQVWRFDSGRQYLFVIAAAADDCADVTFRFDASGFTVAGDPSPPPNPTTTTRAHATTTTRVAATTTTPQPATTTTKVAPTTSTTQAQPTTTTTQAPAATTTTQPAVTTTTSGGPPGSTTTTTTTTGPSGGGGTTTTTSGVALTST